MQKLKNSETVVILCADKQDYRSMRTCLGLYGIDATKQNAPILEDTKIVLLKAKGNEYNSLPELYPNTLFVTICPELNEYFDTDFQIVGQFNSALLIEIMLHAMHFFDKAEKREAKPYIKVGSWRYYQEEGIMIRGWKKWKLLPDHKAILDNLLEKGTMKVSDLRDAVYPTRPYAAIKYTMPRFLSLIGKCPECTLLYEEDKISLITDWLQMRRRLALEKYRNTKAAKLKAEWLTSEVTEEELASVRVSKKRFTRVNYPLSKERWASKEQSND